MTYTPAIGDRITVRRTPGNRGGTSTVTGIVLDILTLGGIPDILDFKDDEGGHVYLASNAQMAEMGVTQTIGPAPAD